MHQQNRMDLLKDYDCNISYNPGKEKVVANAMNRKNFCMMKKVMVSKWKNLEDI